MSIRTDIEEKLMEKIQEVSGWENFYSRRVTYVDSKDWVAKFRTKDKSKYKGLQLWQSGRSTDLVSFKNKLRHIRDFTFIVLIGAKDSDDIISFIELENYLDKLVDHLDINLTLDGTVVDSEFLVVGDIVLDSAAGKTYWMVEMTKRIYKDQIVGSIS